MTSPAEVDPLAGGSTKAVSFKDAPIGTKVVGKVTDYVKMLQSRDYETGEPAFWPLSDADRAQGKTVGNPIMSAVVNLEVDGNEMSLWATKPSAMFGALVDAQKNAGTRIAPGGTLTITYTADKPNAKNPRLNPAKQYDITFEPGDALADGAPF